ncbi:hypothetical protein FDH86_gp049 [Arthrobacter phage Tank]|uniref:Uncharacterized protein n=1 Tax=Arthrobacter phage Tank TaxID=1772319 RepID=A0A0U4KS56_9CAUD|nr:hypothetical protein FDH86_gp049 [Arthrobacter phage Tank]ALY10584.1 hypothetical protein TANK_49 [Arthrobacter phage Tank]
MIGDSIMADMPFDSILDHFANGFDDKLDPDQAQSHAIDLDQELQSKFLFFNIEEEVDSIEIFDRGEGAIQHLGAGSGPEECTAAHGDNPNWLWNHALNAMALARHLEKAQKPQPPQSKESVLANTLLKHLVQQSQRDAADSPYVRPETITDVLIDGHVDILAAATAALAEITAMAEKEGQ